MRLKPAKSGQSQQTGSIVKRSCNAWLGWNYMASSASGLDVQPQGSTRTAGSKSGQAVVHSCHGQQGRLADVEAGTAVSMSSLTWSDLAGALGVFSAGSFS